MIKSEPTDDSASARLWARIDKEKGRGFFDNMWNKPVRSKDWKTYSIEGKIDNGAYQLVFGALCMEIKLTTHSKTTILQLPTKKLK